MNLLRLATVPLLLLAAGSAIAAVAAVGGRFSATLDILSHFAPIYVGIGALAFLSALLPGPMLPRAFLAGMGLAAVVAGGVLIAPELLRRPAPTAPPGVSPTLKLVQFNVWGGNGGGSAISWILAQRPDLVVLQEGEGIRDELARRGGYYISCGGCGVIILSRQAPLRAGSAAPLHPHGDMIAYATFQDHLGEYDVVGVHKSWPMRLARLAVERSALQAVLQGVARDRVLVAGDFNATPWSSGLRGLDRIIGAERRTRALFTWPAGRLSHYRLPAPFPFLPIDHVYAGRDWATVSVVRGPRIGSDHLPVLLTLAPRQK